MLGPGKNNKIHYLWPKMASLGQNPSERKCLWVPFLRPILGKEAHTLWHEIITYENLAITSISGPKKGQIFNLPQFYSKNGPEKPPHLVWGFFTFQRFVFFLIFAFSCLSFSSFPLLLDFLKPKSGPSNEVIGEILYRNQYF